MNPACQKVLSKLIESNHGITSHDFPAGFALSQRVQDLRKKGKPIVTKLERNSGNTGSHARYILTKQEK
jgi:hypothetical protein